MGYSVPIDDMTMITVKKVDREQEKKGFKYWMIHPLMLEVNKLCTECEKYIIDYTGEIELSVKIELILGEFLNNIVMHGLENSQQSRPGILVQIKITDKDVIIKILDKGKKWSFNTSPVPISEDLWNKDEQFATSGRGMTIIRSLASEISRNRYNDLNETVFKIRREPR
jgi:anti-sigma regulatory factor (Ser/Thr protein kinase)